MYINENRARDINRKQFCALMRQNTSKSDLGREKCALIRQNTR